MSKARKSMFIICFIFSLLYFLMLSFGSGLFLSGILFDTKDLLPACILGIGGLLLACIFSFCKFMTDREGRIGAHRSEKPALWSVEILLVILGLCLLAMGAWYLMTNVMHQSPIPADDEQFRDVFVGSAYHFLMSTDMTENLYLALLHAVFYIFGNYGIYALFLNVTLAAVIGGLIYFLYASCYNRLSGMLLTIAWGALLVFGGSLLMDGRLLTQALLLTIILLWIHTSLKKRLLSKDGNVRILSRIITGLIFGALIWLHPVYAIVFLLILMFDYLTTADMQESIKNVFLSNTLMSASLVIGLFLLLIFYKPDLRTVLSMDQVTSCGICFPIILFCFAGLLTSVFSFKKKTEVADGAAVTGRKKKRDVRKEKELRSLAMQEEITRNAVIRSEAGQKEGTDELISQPVKLIPNPMKGPKKHVKKNFEFEIDVPDGEMHYDYPVPDDADHYDL